MARRAVAGAGKRSGSGRMQRMCRTKTKRRPYRRRKPAKRQQRRKRRRDNDSEIQAAIKRKRADYKGKKIKPDDHSDVDTDAGTSLETRQNRLQVFSDETSAGAASCPSDSTHAGKKESKQYPRNRDVDKGGKKRKSRKEKEARELMSGESKTTTERTPARKSTSKKHRSAKRRRSSQKVEEQIAQKSKRNESSKASESAGSGNKIKNVAQEGNEPQNKETTDAKEPSDKPAPKEVTVEEQHEEESSNSSG